MPPEASTRPDHAAPPARPPGRTDASPVFLVGADRSGTTLLFALLASHPDLCMVRRTNVWRYFDGRYGDLAEPANLDRCLDEMCRYRRMRHLAPDADRIRAEFVQGPPSYGRLFALFFEHHAERAGKARWGDKSLHTEHHAHRIFTEFPNARVVHMLRDPRDRYASVRRRNGQDLSRVGAATARWLRSARAAARNSARYPDGYLVVRYEDLARDPERTMRTVCRHVGVRYTERVFEMGGAFRSTVRRAGTARSATWNRVRSRRAASAATATCCGPERSRSSSSSRGDRSPDSATSAADSDSRPASA
ncbi:MAG: hypothetical protein KatS3mg010_1130 [Acidimicrobiia bacterium]|nr:MAG: hypothetical protein KatS3mg010_1130 [Acidimicrobiia bacterium]